MMLGEPRTIPEMWPLAALKAKFSGKTLSEEILDWIEGFLEAEVKQARSSPDVLIGARALIQQ
jgi:hypothetical protein